MIFLMHFSMYCCSVLVSRFLEIESKNSNAFSLDCFKSFSCPRRSNNLAPDSVISVASYLAALRLWSFEFILKSILWPLDSSSSRLSLLCMALYIIYAIFSNSFTAYPWASYSFLALRVILALEAKSWQTDLIKRTRSFSSSISSEISALGSYLKANQ